MCKIRSDLILHTSDAEVAYGIFVEGKGDIG